MARIKQFGVWSLWFGVWSLELKKIFPTTNSKPQTPNNLPPMPDVHTKQQRSYNMSRIKAKDTKPEMLVRRFLHGKGFRYKLHDKTLPGKPDLVLPKYKTIIFIHGCFWHGHTSCKYFVVPKTRTKFWVTKINGNKANDAKAIKTLKKAGWKIIIIWTCHLKAKKLAKTFSKLIVHISASV